MVAIRKRQQAIFSTVHTEGANLPMDLLQRIAQNDSQIAGLTPEAYHLTAEKLNEAINRAWLRVLSAWNAFKLAQARLPETDSGTTLTRERWLLPLFSELGYGRLFTTKPIEIGEKSYSISHSWNHTPIHLVSYKVDLDHMTRSAAGAMRSSPHSLLQELLNRSDEYLWGIVSNGLKLRILRDNVSLTRQAYVEFDLESMMNGEVYADFVLLWLLCHESRVEAERPEECWLEKWSRTAHEQGVRALGDLRDGVEQAITDLGSGFLAHPANGPLREKLRTGELQAQDYYRQILRLVYRLIVLFVAEDRDILFDPEALSANREVYTRYYSTSRLRFLAEQHIGTRHGDLFHSLRLVMNKLGLAEGCRELGLPALNGFLFSRQAIEDLNDCELANYALLAAIRSLAYTASGRTRRVVDYKNLGSEELGSVYESLLELHPVLHIESAKFELASASGNERKTTGSYYTPTSLINCLLDSALDPVLEEAVTQPDPESAILNLKVCDPACGSGHFLVAAAHRMAKKLAYVRTGEEEPTPEARRKALRDVVGKCIYGVDINPMSVELCKVSLWMEAIEPGKPLSFLDAHIQCGNSLLGTTPALLKQGIPDAAFESIEGDDKKVCSDYKKRNKQMRAGQLSLFNENLQPWDRLGDLLTGIMQLEEMGEDTVEDVRRKQEYYDKLVKSSDYEYSKLWADAWCAAFVWKKTREFEPPITEETFRKIERNPHTLAAWMKEEVARLAQQYQFFHWHLAFPDVFRVPGKNEQPENEQTGWSGGFDVVLGNPPWEKIKIQEKEWFASRNPAIANAANAAHRRKMIVALEQGDPALYAAFREDLRKAEGESYLIRRSERYPLCGRGDINTYAIFAEDMRQIVSPTGRVGCIVPSGIATDDTTKFFFQDLMSTSTLASLYSFENEEHVFPAVHNATKFCLMTISGKERKHPFTDFVFFARQTSYLSDSNRHFSLSSDDIAILNPNTRNCPTFRFKRDVELAKAAYTRFPVLIRGESLEENPWQILFSRMFDMANDSHVFCTQEQLKAEGWLLQGNVFYKEKEKFLPLYEGKMIRHFDNRYGTYEGQTQAQANKGNLPQLTAQQHANPWALTIPKYWVHHSTLPDYMQKGSTSLLVLRAITRSVDYRTLIPSIVPAVACGDTLQVVNLRSKSSNDALYLCYCIGSFVFDYFSRQKLGGVKLSFFILKQLPILSPSLHRETCSWSNGISLSNWIFPRALELTYTAWDLEAFAQDCGYDGPPFRWDEERRFLLRCELDAAYFHLYGIKREDVDYIMETFPILKRDDEKQHGEYRTKRVILEIYDEMQRAMEGGQAYQTRLDPPPADPRVAHQARVSGE
ncbi:hypothetical protein KSD_47610 [Ktedonobacter sp. SOSP1-85]|uniref:Eco57I restriction-modification methylase domain-containing protein n=1 Tax=Ktedonobacter sp. SOSP1-85 TaxID=2778367 RepID=UPI0019160DA0|nr:N-6 DNA methylase [Ktedonobacter sp. SOSP1-85]GHO76990.1 hypothetical protein KSD_47610 [Ktedonobacter sp. SOSP1-85]